MAAMLSLFVCLQMPASASTTGAEKAGAHAHKSISMAAPGGALAAMPSEDKCCTYSTSDVLATIV